MSESNKLYNRARVYRDLGWSVVPIWGAQNPDRFKAAAVRWRDFQARRPTDSELHHWFMVRNFGGLAVVCGEVSGLAVLDFDSAEHAAAFARFFPDLAETYTVRSGGRGLPHLYFHIPTHLSTRSRHTPGVDWQYNGAYVVAPPTSSADGTWVVERDVAPKTLSERDLSRIMGFLDTTDANASQNAVTGVSARSSGISVRASRRETDATLDQIIGYYRERVVGGRNKALFETCLWLRDNGASVDAAMALVGIHVAQPAPPGHRAETVAQRREEALKTILSAFSRGSSQPTNRELRVIPNGLRERLLAEKKTAVLRVLEVINEVGWKPGRVFTRAELVEIAGAYDVGDWSVRKALVAVTPDHEPIFPEVATRADAAVLEGVKPPQLNAIELRVSGPTEKKRRGRGRPTTYYLVPSLRALCRLYGVTLLAGDAIGTQALGSVKHYRHALHTALLARRPGQYHRHWLAQRLGVSLRTICRYNSASNIRVSPRYDEYPVIWQNLHNVIPSDLNHPLVSHYGAFLEDETGKRYPPFLPIARMLLSKRHKVRYKRRRLNHYSIVPDVPPPQPPQFVDPLEAVDDLVTGCIAVRDGGLAQPEARPFDILPPVQQVAVAVAPSPPALSLDEQAVVDAVRAATHNTISEARAETLVRQYGPFTVQHALRTLDERQGVIRNRAGFLVRLLATRYGVDGDQVSVAEGVFLALRKADGGAQISWKRAQAIVKQYGTREVSLVLREMHQRNDILNPVGFLVSSLKRNTQPVESVTNPVDVVSRLVDVVRDRCSERSLSRQRAAALVKQYGAKAVTEAISVMMSRDNVNNPAGFMIVYLRSEAKGRRPHKRG